MDFRLWRWDRSPASFFPHCHAEAFGHFHHPSSRRSFFGASSPYEVVPRSSCFKFISLEKITLVGPLGMYDLLSPFLNAYDMKRQVSFIELVPPEKSPPNSLRSSIMHRYVSPSSVESSTYVAYQDQDFAVIAMPIKHSTFCLGYVIFEKAHSLTCIPRKISILGDTCHPWNILPLAR